MEDLFSLKGRVAMVTGAAQGLGAAMAESLARAGAHVVLNDRNAEKLTMRCETLSAKGHSVSGVPFDVTDTPAVEASVRAVAKEHGRLDILVNNAGIAVFKRIENHTVADWERVIAINLTALYALAREAAVPMALGGY